MIATGIDPAATGTAARADVMELRGGVYRITNWRAIRYHRKCWRDSNDDALGDAPTARRWLVEGAAPFVVVEETPAFLRVRCQGGRAVEALITQAEAAGAIVQAVGECLRVHPDTWRPEVLRCRGNDANADVAACAAWGWVSLSRRLELAWQGDGGPLPPEWARPHVAEAACMAVWALRRSSAPRA
jgi:hypothetical protein